MLLNFKTKNFKSYKDGFEFSMEAVGINDISYSLLRQKIKGNQIKALCSSVIYGPNASGKTSVINAMSCFKQIIIRGNIEDEEDNRYDDNVSSSMDLIPFMFEDTSRPVEFDITFTYLKYKYRYFISIVLGNFIEDDFDRYVLEEKLYINDFNIFSRYKNERVELNNLENVNDLLLNSFDMKLAKKNIEIVQKNLNSKILFLSTDFNSYFSKKIVSNITTWIDKYFIVVNKANVKKLVPVFDKNKGEAIIEKYINDVAKEVGIVGSDFAYGADENKKIKLMTVLNKKDNFIDCLPSEVIESVGTIRLINIIPYIFNCIAKGGTLVMDEMDASLHPMIIINILNIFHNNEININKAQLIFNTHNPIYLNNKVLRRDEIKFVERNKETKISELYSLSDFKTNGEISVRNTSDYMKNYFINRYGAIENIDLSDIFVSVVKKDLKK